MGVMRAVEKKDRHQQQCGQAEKGEDNGWVLPAAIIKVHDDRHGGQSCGSPAQLAKQEIVGRAKAVAGHDRGRAEYHDDSNYDQQQNRAEQPFVDADSLGH